MQILEITSFRELLNAIEETSRGSVFRGQENAEWKLIPQIGRVYHYKPKIVKEINPLRVYAEEVVAFEDFKRRATPYVTHVPSDDWQWLTLARHQGLPTRLLDWTDNPLVAAFFACFDNYKQDSAIFVLDRKDVNLVVKSDNPFQINEPKLFEPHHLTSRITAQAGVFTIHCEPHIEFGENFVKKWVISKKCQINIGVQLENFGINYSTLFPGLDGLSKMIIHKFLLYEN